MTTTLARPGLPGRASLSRGAWAAVAVAAAAVLSALAAVLLVTARSAWGLPGLESTVVDVVAAVSVPVMGALVLAAGTGSTLLGRLLLVSGAAAAVSVLTAAIAATATEPSSLGLAAVEVHAWVWVPGFVPLFTLVPLLYPDGRLPSRRWRPVAVLAIAGTALLTVAVALYPQPFRGAAEIPKPWTSQALAEPLGPVAGVVLVLAAAAAVVSLAVRWRRSAPLVRRQIAVLAGAVGVLVLQLLLQPALPVAARGVTQAAAVALLPVAMGVAVTRHRLFDLDLAVSRALLAVSLAACLAGAYLTLFTLLRALLPDQAAVATAGAAPARPGPARRRGRSGGPRRRLGPALRRAPPKPRGPCGRPRGGAQKAAPRPARRGRRRALRRVVAGRVGPGARRRPDRATAARRRRGRRRRGRARRPARHRRPARPRPR